MSGSRRRKPWPYDATINGLGVMLRPSETGLLVGRKTESLERVAPTDYSYASLPPYLERTFAIRRPIGGTGEPVQRGDTGQRSREAINVDQSIGGMWFNGPLYEGALTPPATGGVAGFVEALDGTDLTLFALAGQYVLKRTGDSSAAWTSDKDFGAGVVVQQGVRFQGAYASPVDGLYVTTSAGELWQRTPGGVWTQATLPAGQTAQYVAALNDELWIGGLDRVAKATGDPLLSASWAASIIVGDGATAITWLAALEVLYIWKANGGIYSVTALGESSELFPGLGSGTITDHGQQGRAWLNAVWARRGDNLVRLEGGSGGVELVPSGPELLLASDAETRGKAIAFCGHQTYAGYLAVSNASNGNSYLWKYGSWLDGEDVTAGYSFAPIWNGALVKWTGKVVTTIAVSSVPGPNERLYVGFADGEIGWITLPRGPNPLDDANCRFTTAQSLVYWPQHDGGFPADRKAWTGVSVFGPRISSDEKVLLGYRVDGAATYTEAPAWITESGQRLDLPSGVIGRTLDFYTDLTCSDPATTPILDGLALHERLLPALKLTYDLVVQAADHVARHDGVTSHTRGDAIRDHLKDAADVGETVTVLLPDEVIRSASVTDYGETWTPPRQRHGLGWDVALRLVEYRLSTPYGTIARLLDRTIAELDPMTVEDLGGL